MTILALPVLLFLTLGLLVPTMQAPAVPQPSMATITAALPSFLQLTGSGTVAALPLAAAAPVIAFPNSVQPRPLCSVGSAAPGKCSVEERDTRCSARNGDHHRCSVTGSNTVPKGCSAFGFRTTCSSFGPDQGGTASFCSVLAFPDPPVDTAYCSVIPFANESRCTVRTGQSDECSASTSPANCSVITPPIYSPRWGICSSSGAGHCTVFTGGQCTAFGGGHCSFIGGPTGSQCSG
jgi:hypothetical protein